MSLTALKKYPKSKRITKWYKTIFTVGKKNYKKNFTYCLKI